METARDAAHSRIFDGLTHAERLECFALARDQTVRRGEWLARQGEPASTFYLVAQGALKVLQGTADGVDLIVRFVGPGDPFGGVVVLREAPYPVSAVAVEPTRLHAWPSAQLHTVLDRFPRVRINIMREMTAHMTDALTRVREMTTQRVGQRLAMTLIRLTRQCGRTTEAGLLITHVLTRQELADLTGTTLYTVSRTLSQWEQDGVIVSHGRQLTVIRPDRLAALSRE